MTDTLLPSVTACSNQTASSRTPVAYMGERAQVQEAQEQATWAQSVQEHKAQVQMTQE